MQGKPLAALETELNLGLTIYAAGHPDVFVKVLVGMYAFVHFDWRNGGTAREKLRSGETFTVIDPDPHPDSISVMVHASGYGTFEELLQDWPHISKQPIWSTKQQHPDWLPYRDQHIET